MVDPQNLDHNSAFSAFCKPVQKPLSPVCKCLFGFSDGRETKRMLENALAMEARRFKSSWNFDVSKTQSAGDESKISGVEAKKSPMSVRPTRYDWQVWQDSVPHFYKRQVAVNPAKTDPTETRSPKIQKLHGNRSHRVSPSPLGRRDENATNDTVTSSPQSVRKPTTPRLLPDLINPPKIVSTVLNPAVTRLVTAVRLPQVTTPAQDNDVASDEAVTSSNEEKVVTSSTIEPKVAGTRKSLKRVAPRQLFVNTRNAKRNRLLQPKISDMMSHRKPRSQTNKLNGPQTANHVTSAHVTSEAEA